MKKVAIIQPNYIPWKGYFDIINYVDEFVLLDDVQYTKRDWRNRNIIKTSLGAVWLTIPVKTKSKYHQLIKDVEIDGNKWQEKHFMTLLHQYSKEDGFAVYKDAIEKIYQREYVYLVDVLVDFLKEINAILGITTRLSRSSDFHAEGSKSDRLIGLCKAVGATHYVSGPKAKVYLDEKRFEAEHIQVEWYNYKLDQEEEMKQGDALNVSILDLIFKKGKEARTLFVSP